MNEILTKSLREQVYEYLKREISNNNLKSGEFININDISEKLGISKTPLRDALLQLEMDGFVKIYPRKGIVVNRLELNDIKNIYEIIGALECSVINSIADKFNDSYLDQMDRFNTEMKDALKRNNFTEYYDNNLNFHNVYIELSDNKPLMQTLITLKQRLYDFPPNSGYVAEWELNSTKEHDELIRLFSAGDFKAAGDFIKDVHWSFDVQRRYIELYYFGDKK